MLQHDKCLQQLIKTFDGEVILETEKVDGTGFFEVKKDRYVRKTLDKLKLKVLDILEDSKISLRAAEIAANTPDSLSDIEIALRELHKEGEVVKDGFKWALADEGTSHAV
jgi:hypothetical protein